MALASASGPYGPGFEDPDPGLLYKILPLTASLSWP